MAKDPLDPTMNRLICLVTGWTAQAFGIAGQIKMNLALFRHKADICHLPRRLQAQSRCEQQIGIHPNMTSAAVMKEHQAKLISTENGRAPFCTKTVMLRANAFPDLVEQFRGVVRHDTQAYKSMTNDPLKCSTLRQIKGLPGDASSYKLEVG